MIQRVHHKFSLHILPMLLAAMWGVIVMLLTGCGSAADDTSDDLSLRRVMTVQALRNLSPGTGCASEMEIIIDSMRTDKKDACYFAAVNVLIDQLFSDGRYSEADRLAVKMHEEANQMGDSLSLAMAKRVRAQMFYKLNQPQHALRELEPAAGYISHPLRSGKEFGTATNINEWLWIIYRSLGDTARMQQAGRLYSTLVHEREAAAGDIDSTGHFPVSALAFDAQTALDNDDYSHAEALLCEAACKVKKNVPARAYEHFYMVRSNLRAATGDWTEALADADTLLSTHSDFPWFYLDDLILKARILGMVGKHEESAKAYSHYIALHDSLSEMLSDQRLQDLTILYRSELESEHVRTHRFQMLGLGAVSLVLLILFATSAIHTVKQRKRNKLLVERLKELDRTAAYTSAVPVKESREPHDDSPIERLDRYMLTHRPYTNPGLSRKELSEFLKTTPDVVAQIIRTERGISVLSYINTFRLDEARRVLGSASGESIAEIASRLGFGTPRTLQRAFKERYDMSPSQYRSAASALQTSDDV